MVFCSEINFSQFIQFSFNYQRLSLKLLIFYDIQGDILGLQASGGQDQIIHIWNANTLDWLHTFKGHRNQITVRCL